MLFNSFGYLVFLPCVVALFWFLPVAYRWWFLLLASCGFYMAFVPVYIAILGVIVVIDFYVGLKIDSCDAPLARRRWLLVSIAANVGILFSFKYLDWFLSLVTGPLSLPAWRLGLMLPLGLSFHVFQSLAYTVDVYRRQTPVERHLGRFALYVLIFPQMVAGPIERPQHLLPQLWRPSMPTPSAWRSGLRLILLGYLKKSLFADNLAVLVERVFDRPGVFDSSSVILAAVVFSFQIYGDFSGYTDIARGSALLLGINLRLNFLRPQLATSPHEFWRRWHVSLSTWFRDFVYLPLGGSQRGSLRTWFNTMITFGLSGLWHGANFTYLCWGLFHGMMVSVTKRLPARLWGGAFGWLFTIATMSIGFIFFRSHSMVQAWHLLRAAFGMGERAHDASFGDLFSVRDLQMVLVLICGLLLLEWVSGQERFRTYWFRSRALRWLTYYAAILLLVVYGRFDERHFIYFQF
ncbi:MAG: MBOAT family protein [Bdellovibrionales bacterium]|nr:MBOAT family protein [Bdellovibrionales bacterium]